MKAGTEPKWLIHKILRVNPKTIRKTIKSCLASAIKTFGTSNGIYNLRIVQSVKEFKNLEKQLTQKGFKRIVVAYHKHDFIKILAEVHKLRMAGGFVRIFGKGRKVIPIIYIHGQTLNIKSATTIVAHEIGHIIADLKMLELGQNPDHREVVSEMLAQTIEAEILLQNNFSKKEILGQLKYKTGLDFKVVEMLLDSRFNSKQRRDIINNIIIRNIDPKFIVDYIEEYRRPIGVMR
ncbi:MAG: hypothetical protein Q7S21_00725 [archaeon]|nr:hypothetical protein [archaeon]